MCGILATSIEPELKRSDEHFRRYLSGSPKILVKNSLEFFLSFRNQNQLRNIFFKIFVNLNLLENNLF